MACEGRRFEASLAACCRHSRRFVLRGSVPLIPDTKVWLATATSSADFGDGLTELEVGALDLAYLKLAAGRSDGVILIEIPLSAPRDPLC
jgi:hypothetical protein